MEGERTPCCWDSLHVFEVSERGGRTTSYELTSTVMLSLGRVQEKSKINLAGSLTRQVRALRIEIIPNYKRLIFILSLKLINFTEQERLCRQG